MKMNEKEKKWEKEFLQTHSLYWLASDIYYGVDHTEFHEMLEPNNLEQNTKKVQYTGLVKILPDEIKKKLEEKFRINKRNLIIRPLFENPIGNVSNARKILLEFLPIDDGEEEKEEIFNRCKNELYNKIRTWFPASETCDRVIEAIEKFFFSRKIIYSYENEEDFLCYTNQTFFDYLMNEKLEFISIKSNIEGLACGDFESFEDKEKFKVIREKKDTLLAEGDFFAIGREEKSGMEILINKESDQAYKIVSLEGNLDGKNRGIPYKIYCDMVEKDPYEAITVAFLLSIFMSAVPEHKQDLINLLFIKYDQEKNTDKIEEEIKKMHREMKQMGNNITKIMNGELNSVVDKTSQSEQTLNLIVEDIVRTDSYFNEGILKDRFCELSKIDGNFYKNTSELCFLNYFIFKNYSTMEEEVEDLFDGISKEQLLKNCYEFCNKKGENHPFRYAYAKKYFGLVFAEYARFIYGCDEYGKTTENLKSIIEKAKKYLGYRPDSLVELEADLQMEGAPGYPQANKNYNKIHKLLKGLYIKTGKESLIDKMIVNLESAKENGVEGSDDALRQIKRLYNQKVDNDKTVKEKYIEIIQQEAMDKYKKRQKQGKEKKENTGKEATVNDNDIYIVTGIGDATEAFLNSTANRPNAMFWVLPQRGEKIDDNFLKHVTENGERKNIEIFELGYHSLFHKPEFQIFYLDELWQDGEEDIFEKYEKRKIHFLLIGENKKENLGFAVEIIKRAYEKYYLYKSLLDVISINTVDKESKKSMEVNLTEIIDIKLDVESEMSELYLDALINRFDEDFYIPISFFSWKRKAVEKLLTDYPIYAARESGSGYHVIVCGDENQEDIIFETILSILLVSVFKPLDKSQKDVGGFEQSIGKDFSLDVICSHADRLEERLKRQAPDLFENCSYIHCRPEFYSLNVNGPEFMNLFMCREEQSGKPNVHGCNYFICLMDDDEISMRMGMDIRRQCYRSNSTFKHQPMISVLCKHTPIDININEFSVGGGETYQSIWYKSYQINQFGQIEDIYSYDNIYHNFLEKASRELHCEGREGDSREKRICQYFRSTYNRLSCDVRALFLPYMFYCVIGKKKKWKNIQAFKQSLNECIKMYNYELENNPQYVEQLACLEHNRWVVFMTLQGYTSFEKTGNLEEYVRGWTERMIGNGKKQSKLHVAKIHPAITTYEKLGMKKEIMIQPNKKQELVGKLKEMKKTLYDDLYCHFLGNYYCRKRAMMAFGDEKKDLWGAIEGEITERKFHKNIREQEQVQVFINGTLRRFKELWRELINTHQKFEIKELAEWEENIEILLGDCVSLWEELWEYLESENQKTPEGFLTKGIALGEQWEKVANSYDALTNYTVNLQDGTVKNWLTWLTNPDKNNNIKLYQLIQKCKNFVEEYKYFIKSVIYESYETSCLETVLLDWFMKFDIILPSKSNRFYNESYVKNMPAILEKINSKEKQGRDIEITEQKNNNHEIMI